MMRAFAFALLLLLPHFPAPDPVLTPGDVLTKDVGKICTPGYASSVRNVPFAVRHAAFDRYHVLRSRWHLYELDHLVSLQLGGSNDGRNLWPEPFPGAYSKDSVENSLHRAICSGRLQVDSAQRWIAHNWMGAYRAMKRGQL